MEIIKTVPSDMWRPYDSRWLNSIILAVRECASNARNYGAKEMYFFLLHKDGEDFLVVAHNGKSFASVAEIKEAGCMPNTSGGEGHSFQGCGLVYCASNLNDTKPLLAIASWVDVPGEEDQILVSAEGYISDPLSNQWHARENNKWAKVIEECGTNFSHKFNVFYVFSTTIYTKSDNGFYLKLQLMNALGYLAPGIFEGLSCKFSERQLGLPTYPKELNADLYKNVDTVLTGGGSGRNPVVPASEYEQMYAERTFEFQSDEFEFEVESQGQMNKTIKAKAKISVSCFPNTRNDESSSSSWMEILRDVHDGAGKLQHKKGSAGPPGKKLDLTAFMSMSCIAQGDRKNLMRFRDGAAFFSATPYEFMSALGLPYRDPDTDRRRMPFVIVKVDITDISNVLVYRKETFVGEEETSPLRIANKFFHRRPDFMFEDKFLTRRLVKEACRAAHKHVPAALKEMCQRYFPPEKDELLALPVGGAMGKEPPGTRKKRFKIFSLTTGAEFDHSLKTDTPYFLAVYDSQADRFLESGEITVMSKGVRHKTLGDPNFMQGGKEIAANMAKISKETGSQVQAISLHIHPPAKLVNEQWTLIDPSEWLPNPEHTPSRTIRAVAHGCGMLIGTVEDLPSRVVEETSEKDKKTAGRRSGRAAAHHSQEVRFFPYCSRKANIFLMYDEDKDVVLLNREFQWTKDYFVNKPHTERSKKLLRQLYGEIENLAKSVALACKHVRRIDADNQCYDDHGGETGYIAGNPYDYMINRVCTEYLNTNPYVAEILNKVNEEMERISEGAFDDDDQDSGVRNVTIKPVLATA